MYKVAIQISLDGLQRRTEYVYCAQDCMKEGHFRFWAKRLHSLINSDFKAWQAGIELLDPRHKVIFYKLKDIALCGLLVHITSWNETAQEIKCSVQDLKISIDALEYRGLIAKLYVRSGKLKGFYIRF